MAITTEPFVNLGAQFSTDPKGVACSDNGEIVYVVDGNSDSLYRSTDSGVTFTDLGAQFSSQAYDVSCSNDGSIVYVVDSTSAGGLFRSDDFGVSFIIVSTSDSMGSTVRSVACSGDGVIVYAISISADEVLRSSDSGSNFSSLGSIFGFDPDDVACSDDGSVVYVINSGSLYVSIDDGANFVTKALPSISAAVACSSDGSTVYALIAFGSNLIASDDYGDSFIDLGAQFSATPSSVACSSNGLTVYVIDQASDSIYRSLTVLPSTVCLVPEPLPETSNFPLNYGRFGYESTINNGTASANSDDIGSGRMLTPSTWDKWRPVLDPSNCTLIGTSKLCNYVGIAAHNLGAEGATVVVSVGDGTTTTEGFNELVPSDRPLFIRFD